MQTNLLRSEIFPEAVALGKAAANDAARLIRAAIRERGSANVIVATGSSQFNTIEALVAEPDIAWDKVIGFHLDEYVGMPITHPASFRQYLWKRFVSRLALPLATFHYVVGDAAEPAAECARLNDIIAAHPIDVAFVGIGENGHLAFNDPPADFATEAPFIVVELDEGCRRQQLGEGWFPNLAAVPTTAISMSVRQIMKSRAIVCSVPDRRKADAVRKTLRGDITPDVPASILQAHADCAIYLDPESASLLEA